MAKEGSVTSMQIDDKKKRYQPLVNLQ